MSPSENSRVVLYARVSTDGQTVENQIQALQDVANKLNWTIVKILRDEGISGAKGRQQRPGLNELHKAVIRKEVDMVAAWSVDRLGRSLQDLLSLLNTLNEREVALYLHQQGLDTSTSAGRAMFQMLGVFAEFERSLIQERVKSGLARARQEGKRLGRPPVSAELVESIQTARLRGDGILKIAKSLSCGVGTVQRVVRDMAIKKMQ